MTSRSGPLLAALHAGPYDVLHDVLRLRVPSGRVTEFFARLQAALAERYRLERELGRGGMAIVYLGQDLKHGRLVAVKVLPPELASAVLAQRFVREIKIAAALTHPHILPVYDSDEADGFLYYVMPYVEGESLRGRLNRERQLPVEDALRITGEVADALSYAHSYGVVHRDIKPDNILFQAGHAVVSDFGIARALTTAGGERLTETRIIVGTSGYMSPEQAQRSGEVDGRSDLYSLACVLYEMLVGDLPFQGWSPEAILARQLSEPVPRLRAVRDSVPEEVERAVVRALSKAPVDRFPTVAQFAEALTAPSSGLPSPQTAAPAPRATPASKSIAVLPFVNLSADPENEYFSDGMTEELMSALAKVSGLRVASRTSAFAFKGKHQDIRTIGRQLNVSTVLEGSVRKAGNKLRITAQLVDVADGYDLWADIYERQVKDVFAIQEEISRAIVATLRVKLGSALATPVIEPHTQNIDAYTAYLRARYFWRRKSASGLQKCIEYFREAIAADPSYALAHAGLADSYLALGYISYVPPKQAFPKAKAAAEKALALDGTLAEAHTASACVSMYYDWDWDRAERSLKQAIALKPRYAVAQFWYSCYLAAVGRSAESLEAISRAHALAPLSLMTNANVGLALYFARRYDEAIAQCRRTVELEPTFFLAHTVLGLACAHNAMFEEAVAAFEQAITFSAGLPYTVAGLGYAYGRAGRSAEAQRVLEELRKRSEQQYVSSFCFVMVHTGLGDTEQAFAWLDQAYGERSHWLAYANAWPLLDPLRSDARFATLVAKLGLR